MLKELVRKNLTYLHLYNGFLKNTSDEGEIQAYVEGGTAGHRICRLFFFSDDGETI